MGRFCFAIITWHDFIFTLLITIITTVATIIGTIIVRKLNKNHEHLEQIHILVNNRMSEALERIAALEKALAIPPGAPVPVDKGGS